MTLLKASLTLQETRSIHDSMNIPKIEFISLTTGMLQVNRITIGLGAQWLSGRVLDSRPRCRKFKPHQRHCVVVLEQDTFILA